jgi:hypothetical protein
MNTNIVFLPGEPSAIGHFLRVGTSGQRQIETLLGAGRSLACSAGDAG